MQLPSEAMEFYKAAGYTTAATTAINGTGVDLAGWDGVIILASYGTPAANNLIHAEQSSDNSTYTDIADSEITLSGASDEDQWLVVHRPAARYVRGVALRGTSSTLEAMWTIKYGKKQPAVADNLTDDDIYGGAIIDKAAGTK